MGVSGGHCDRLMSHEFLNCLLVYRSHHQTASDGDKLGPNYFGKRLRRMNVLAHS